MASARVEFQNPIRGSRRVQVALWVSRLGGKSWDFDYRITDAADDTVYAEDRTVQVAYWYEDAATVPIDDDPSVS